MLSSKQRLTGVAPSPAVRRGRSSEGMMVPTPTSAVRVYVLFPQCHCARLLVCAGQAVTGNDQEPLAWGPPLRPSLPGRWASRFRLTR